MKPVIDTELGPPIRPKFSRRITTTRLVALMLGLGLAAAAQAERFPRRARSRPRLVPIAAAPVALAPTASIDPGMIHPAPAGIDDRMVHAAPAEIDEKMIVDVAREAPAAAAPGRP
jgi:hypothetical protein